MMFFCLSLLLIAAVAFVVCLAADDGGPTGVRFVQDGLGFVSGAAVWHVVVAAALFVLFMLMVAVVF